MKFAKKLLCLSLVFVMILASLTACGKKGKTLAEITEAGELVVATSPDFEPFEYISDGKVVGIEVDMMNIICEKLGVKLVLKEMNFDSVIPGIVSCKYDCGMSGISVTPERMKNVLFTDAYCLAAQCIVVKADSTITSKADLAGKTVSVQTGTTAEEFCTGEGYTVNSYEANADAKTALTTGKVQAWVVDDLTAAAMCEGDSTVKILDENMTTEPYAFAFAFGSEDLVAKINEILAELMESGKVKEIFEKYNAPYTAPAAK
jgi:polar amino acid transport system substrate-binding protein